MVSSTPVSKRKLSSTFTFIGIKTKLLINLNGMLLLTPFQTEILFWAEIGQKK
jgi:hypothetical protein